MTQVFEFKCRQHLAKFRESDLVSVLIRIYIIEPLVVIIAWLCLANHYRRSISQHRIEPCMLILKYHVPNPDHLSIWDSWYAYHPLLNWKMPESLHVRQIKMLATKFLSIYSKVLIDRNMMTSFLHR